MFERVIFLAMTLAHENTIFPYRGNVEFFSSLLVKMLDILIIRMAHDHKAEFAADGEGGERGGGSSVIIKFLWGMFVPVSLLKSYFYSTNHRSRAEMNLHRTSYMWFN